ncbi:MAG: flavodoxin family protein [Candidatus Goldiibacteriota bacterium]
MPELLIITASPRKNSHTKKIAEYAAAAAGEKTAHICDITSKKINPCIACGKCRETFTCFRKDDAQEIINKIKKASKFIVVSPVYFSGVPSQFKAFIDRNQPVWERNIKRKKFKTAEKRGIIILLAGGRNPGDFMPAKREITALYKTNGIKPAGAVFIKGTDSIKDIQKEKGIKPRIKKAVAALGDDRRKK